MSTSAATVATDMAPLGLGLGSGVGNNNQHGGAVSSKANAISAAASADAFLESRATSVDARDDKGRTALHFASRMKSAECVRLLVEAGADPNARDKEGFTPLHMAAGYGRAECATLLLEHGASMLVRDRMGRTPRQLAIEIRDEAAQGWETSGALHGELDTVIEILLDAEGKATTVCGRDLQKVPGKWSPGMLQKKKAAAVDNHLPYLPADSSSNSVAAKKMMRITELGNALSAACRGGHVDVADLLLANGAQVDAQDRDGATPLLAAADSGSAKCVQLLLKHGAKPDAKDHVGVTALIAAAYNGHTECVTVLLEHGATLDARSHGGVTPLIAAAEGCNALCTRLLVQVGAKIDAKTSEGKTALMHAVHRNCIEATEALLIGGADVNATDADGCTALHHGARNDSADCLQMLLDRNADFTRKCRRGRTPWQDAPEGSAAAKLLEQKWKQLELEIAQRQAELLDLFAQDQSELTSITPKKSSSRHTREKKKGRRKKEAAEKVESIGKAGGDPTKPALKSEQVQVRSVDVLSSSGSEVKGESHEVDNEQPVVDPGMVQAEAIVEEDTSVESCDGGAIEQSKSPARSVLSDMESSDLLGLETASSASSTSQLMGNGAVAGEEDSLEQGQEWIKVDGKSAHHQHQRPISDIATTAKAQGSNAKSPAGAKAGGLLSLNSLKMGEIPPSTDILALPLQNSVSNGQSPTNRKLQNAQRKKQVDVVLLGGVTKAVEDENLRDGDLSPWVQALRRGNHIGADANNNTRPGQVRGDMKAASHSEARSEVTSWDPVEFTKETHCSPKEHLMEHVCGVEQGLERERRVVQVEMQKVRELGRLVSAQQGLGNGLETATALPVIELTHALEAQVTARIKAETAKRELEIRIRDMEVLIESQRKSIEVLQASGAELKQEMLRREEQHKQECDRQHRDSFAAAMAAAATSWRAWELQRSKETLQSGWQHGCEDNSEHDSFAPLLHLPSHKNCGGVIPTTRPVVISKKDGGDHREREEPVWESAVTAAAMAAATMIGSKYCACLLDDSATLSPPLVSCVSQNLTTTKSVTPKTFNSPACPVCNWCQDMSQSRDLASLPLVTTDGDMITERSHSPDNSHDDGNSAAHQIANKSTAKCGGMTRSASEGSLNLMEGVSEQQQQQQLLPFVPMAGPQIDPVNGWFSLVPSPVED